MTLIALMVKEMRHLLRDRQTLAILLLLPLAELLLFGYGVSLDVNNVRVAVVAATQDAATQSLIARFDHSARFTLVATPARVQALDELFRRGAADVGVVLPPDLATARPRGGPGSIQVIVDATDPNFGSTVAEYTRSVIAQWQAVGGLPRIEIASRARFNPALRSANLFVPGLIALIITLVTSLMTALSLSRERERGTWALLLVSPLTPWRIIVGKILPYLGLAIANIITVLVAAVLIFKVPLIGSITLLMAASVLFSLVGLALGVLIATVTNSQLAAMLGAVVGTILPNTMLSGLVFPIDSMPAPLQLVSHIVPARWFIVIARGIMLKGTGFAVLWSDFAILTVMFLVLMVVSIRASRPRLG